MPTLSSLPDEGKKKDEWRGEIRVVQLRRGRGKGGGKEALLFLPKGEKKVGELLAAERPVGESFPSGWELEGMKKKERAPHLV